VIFCYCWLRSACTLPDRSVSVCSVACVLRTCKSGCSSSIVSTVIMPEKAAQPDDTSLPIVPSLLSWKIISALYQIEKKKLSGHYRMLAIHAPFLLLAMLHRPPSLARLLHRESLVVCWPRAESTRLALPWIRSGRIAKVRMTGRFY
jgi:hypothetical protein